MASIFHWITFPHGTPMLYHAEIADLGEKKKVEISFKKWNFLEDLVPLWRDTRSRESYLEYKIYNSQNWHVSQTRPDHLGLWTKVCSEYSFIGLIILGQLCTSIRNYMYLTSVQSLQAFEFGLELHFQPKWHCFRPQTWQQRKSH